jgi:hypothetical protein
MKSLQILHGPNGFFALQLLLHCFASEDFSLAGSAVPSNPEADYVNDEEGQNNASSSHVRVGFGSMNFLNGIAELQGMYLIL